MKDESYMIFGWSSDEEISMKSQSSKGKRYDYEIGKLNLF